MSDIQEKRAHDATCSFPEVHKCEFHLLTFEPKFVSMDDIDKEGHGWTVASPRNKNLEKVLRSENVVVFSFSQEKASAVYLDNETQKAAGIQQV